MNIVKFALYSIFIGFLGLGLTAEAMQRPVVRTASLAGKTAAKRISKNLLVTKGRTSTLGVKARNGLLNTTIKSTSAPEVEAEVKTIPKTHKPVVPKLKEPVKSVRFIKPKKDMVAELFGEKAKQDLVEEKEISNESTESDTLVPVRNQTNSDSATQLVPVKDTPVLVEIDSQSNHGRVGYNVKLTYGEDNILQTLVQRNLGNNNQLAVKNNVKDQVLVLETKPRGGIKKAVLLLPSDQVKNILKINGLKLGTKSGNKLFIPRTQVNDAALNRLTHVQKPALPEARGQVDQVPMLPGNNGITKQPLEQPREFSLAPKHVQWHYPLVSAGKAKTPKLIETPVYVAPKPIARAARPANMNRLPKEMQSEQKRTVSAGNVKAEVRDNNTLAVEAAKVEPARKEQRIRDNDVRVEEVKEKERNKDEQELKEEENNKEREREEKDEERERRCLEREEEQKEQERERERDEQREKERIEREKEEELAHEKEKKEAEKRTKRARRGEKQRAEVRRSKKIKAPSRATRVVRQVRRNIEVAGPATAIASPSPVMPIPAQPIPVTTPPPHMPVGPVVPVVTPEHEDVIDETVRTEDPRIADYRKILRTARKPTADIINDATQRMDTQWAHEEDPGVKYMIEGFNRCADVLSQLSPAERQGNDWVITTSFANFESVKTKIAQEMIRLLTSLGVNPESN